MRRQQAPDPDNPTRRGFSPKWIIIGVTAAVVLLVGGPWIYVTFLNDDQPAPLSLSATSPSSSASSALASGTSSAAQSPAAASSASSPAAAAPAAGGLAGTWTVAADSVVGYRVKEILLGQSTDAVGRTSDVTGELTVDGSAVTAATFTADLTTVKSDKSQRDGQFRGRIMDTDTHPTAKFAATAPIAVPAEALAGGQFTSKATGDLTLRGTTKSVTFDISGQKAGDGFELTAQIPIHFPDFDIPNPSAGPAKVGDDGTLEILLKLARG